MSVQENIQSAKDYYAYFNARDMDGINAQHAEDMQLVYSPGQTGPLDEQQSEMMTRGLWTAFPDIQLNITLQVAQGDYVVTHWIATATHTGPLTLPSGQTVGPTGKSCTLQGCTTMEIVDGRHKRAWNHYDQMALLGQLGLLPGM
jgi:predicted ester cyclase